MPATPTFIGEIQVALFEYRKRGGRHARAVLLGPRTWMAAVRDASAMSHYLGVDRYDPEVLAKVLGVDVFSSQRIPPDAVIPLGDPQFDALSTTEAPT